MVTVSAAEADGWPPVSLGVRLAAILYDVLLVAALLILAAALALAVRGGEAPPTGASWYSLYLLAVVYAFFVGFWAHSGQTLGMRAWRLHLRRRDGGRVGLAAASLRFAAAAMSLAAFGLGFAWQLIDRERLSWHDRLSGSVIRRRPQGAASSRD